MTLAPGPRKAALAVHLTASVGWLGAVAAYLALDVTVATSSDAGTLRASYLGMDLIARDVLAPLAIGALLTGIALSLGTKWGLFRHYWVLLSLVLTLMATAVLLIETRTISRLAAVAADPASTDDTIRRLGSTLVHSVGGLIVLLVILVLNLYKPRGLTRYGWRKQQSWQSPRQGV